MPWYEAFSTDEYRTRRSRNGRSYWVLCRVCRHPPHAGHRRDSPEAAIADWKATRGPRHWGNLRARRLPGSFEMNR